MKSFESGKFDPRELIENELWTEAREAPTFLGNCSEIDSLDTQAAPDKANEHDGQVTDFVGEIAAETIAAIRRIDPKTLRKKSEGSNPYFIDDRVADIEEDPLLALEARSVIGVANLLLQNDQFDDAEIILTVQGRDEKRIPKWPNEYACVHMLAQIAEKRGGPENVVDLLTDPDGDYRFPDRADGLRLLTHALNALGRHADTVKTAEAEFGRNGSLLKNSPLFLNYALALNQEGRHDEIIERFVDRDAFKVPCPLKPAIAASLGIALNARRMYQKTYEIMAPLLRRNDFRLNHNFIATISIAMNALGLHREAIDLLMEKNGRYRFPESRHCMRSLAYHLIDIGRISEAEKLLGWVFRRGYPASDFSGVQNALQRSRTVQTND